MTIAFSKIGSVTRLQGDAQPLVAARGCPICGAQDYRVVEEIAALQFFSDPKDKPKHTTVRQVGCRSCLTLYMNPCYTDYGFETLFVEAGRSYGDGGSRHDEQIAWMQKHNLLSAEATYMDIGCFEGEFLSNLPVGKQFIGIDFDKGAIERAKTRFDKEHYTFIQGRFEEMVLESPVDVYTMFHVLEHLPDPVGVLKRLRQFAHEKTALIVEVPVLEKGNTNDIHGFFSPQHLTHFSKHTLKLAFAQAGWSIADAEDAEDYNGHRVVGYPDDSVLAVEPELTDYVTLQEIRGEHAAALAEAEKHLETIPDSKKLIIWGAGMHLEYLYQRTTLFERDRSRHYVLVDGDETKQGTCWHGLTIHAPTELQNIDWEGTALLISSYGSQEKIREAAIGLGIPADNIYAVYDMVKTY